MGRPLAAHRGQVRRLERGGRRQLVTTGVLRPGLGVRGRGREVRPLRTDVLLVLRLCLGLGLRLSLDLSVDLEQLLLLDVELVEEELVRREFAEELDLLLVGQDSFRDGGRARGRRTAAQRQQVQLVAAARV